MIFQSKLYSLFLQLFYSLNVPFRPLFYRLLTGFPMISMIEMIEMIEIILMILMA